MARGDHASHPYDQPPRLPEGDTIDLSALLGVSDRCEIIVGPGRGAFVLQRAAAHPERGILGIEIRRKWACIVDQRLARHRLHPRARVVCEDARLALPRLGPAGSVQALFAHFPDPWWKKRHRKRLVVGKALIEQAARLLAVGGELFVQTDVPERAEQYRREIEAVGGLLADGGQPGEPWLHLNPYGQRSNRERRAERDGLPVLRLRYRRVAG